MNHTPGTTAAGNGGNFDPRQAVALLDQTTGRARRQFESSPPWLLALRGVGVLIALGVVWLSVRGQHPYRHPTAAVIPVVVTFGVLNLVATVTVARRATAGVRGRTRPHWAAITVLVVVWFALFAVMGVLAGTRLSDGFVYGIYPVAVPLIAVGLAWAGITAVHADWRDCGTGLAVAVVGAIAVAAGPVGAWAVAGVGLCAVLLGSAAITWRQRA